MQPVPILLYHSVDTSCSPAYARWNVTPQTFARQMEWLLRESYRPVTVSFLQLAMAKRAELPTKPVVITFDDGLRDFAIGAMPVLDRVGFTATLYVVSGRVGQTSTWLAALGEGDRPMLTWGELDDLCQRGIECGAHTITHPQLDILSTGAARSEIAGSKARLEDKLGRRVDTFAYPHGYASAATRDIVRKAGFASACRVRHAMSATHEDPYAISRIIVTDDMDDAAFAAMLRGSSLPVAPPVDRLVASGWRLVRRVDNALRVGR